MHGNHVRQLVMCPLSLVVNPVKGGSVFRVNENGAPAQDGNAAMEALPRKTTDRAMTVVPPGERVHVRGGTSTTPPLHSSWSSGSLSKSNNVAGDSHHA